MQGAARKKTEDQLGRKPQAQSHGWLFRPIVGQASQS